MKEAAFSALCAALTLTAIAPASAQESCAPPAQPRLRDYKPVLLQCRNDAGETRLATRRMEAEGGALLLTVDPETLAAKLERAACWSCEATDDEAQKDTRFLRAVRPPAEPDRPAILKNAGLLHGKGAGSFVTGDLCPSRKPLDKAFLERLAKEGEKTPVALAVSGLWIKKHRADFEWLKETASKGALDITWVNHSYSHPYKPGRPDAATYLLTPGVDLEKETLGAERLMIEEGLTLSVFFRFPGLVADDRLIEAVRARHLIALGADAWIALGPAPRPGSIVLVHPNGNEPVGLKLFERLLEKGKMPRPFRRIEEAP